MNNLRLNSINGLIRDKRRTTVNVECDPLYDCDVCWTCKHFKIEQGKCVLTYEDAKKRRAALSTVIEYFLPVPIKIPGWYRCIWWEE